MILEKFVFYSLFKLAYFVFSLVLVGKQELNLLFPPLYSDLVVFSLAAFIIFFVDDNCLCSAISVRLVEEITKLLFQNLDTPLDVP